MGVFNLPFADFGGEVLAGACIGGVAGVIAGVIGAGAWLMVRHFRKKDPSRPTPSEPPDQD